MGEVLTTTLLQSGLPIGGVLVLVYLVREVFQLHSALTSEENKTNKLDKQVAVLTARLNFVQGIKKANGDGD